MTPEERAKKITDDGEVFDRTLEEDIASAIRTAENDALERAALTCESDAEDNAIDYYERMGLRSAAETIRALKHKDVE